jgi:hypothetical protein
MMSSGGTVVSSTQRPMSELSAFAAFAKLKQNSVVAANIARIRIVAPHGVQYPRQHTPHFGIWDSRTRLPP